MPVLVDIPLECLDIDVPSRDVLSVVFAVNRSLVTPDYIPALRNLIRDVMKYLVSI